MSLALGDLRRPANIRSDQIIACVFISYLMTVYWLKIDGRKWERREATSQISSLWFRTKLGLP